MNGWEMFQDQKWIIDHIHDADIWLLLTHLPLDKMAAILADNIFKCIFLN